MSYDKVAVFLRENIKKRELAQEKIMWNKRNTFHAKNIAKTIEHMVSTGCATSFYGHTGGVCTKVTLDGKTIWHLPNYTEFEHVPETYGDEKREGKGVIAERLSNLYGGKWVFSTNTDKDFTALGGCIRDMSKQDRFPWLKEKDCAFVNHTYMANGKLYKGNNALYLRLKDKYKPTLAEKWSKYYIKVGRLSLEDKAWRDAWIMYHTCKKYTSPACVYCYQVYGYCNYILL